MLVGCGAQGENMAAWQNAQVASLWTGGGRDSRGGLMVGPDANRATAGGSAPAATPTTNGRASRSSRSRRPVCIERKVNRWSRGFKPSSRRDNRNPPDRPLGRKDEPEGRALARNGLRPDPSAVQLHELLGQREPQPGALGLPAGRALHLAELLEQLAHILRRDADARIRDRDPGD